MTFSMQSVVRQSNPVDVIELVATSREWSFERSCEDEIAVSVRGLWTDYSVSLSWMEDCEALHLACAFDLKIPEHRRVEALRLVSMINEQLVIGHFDIWQDQGAVMFRHALLLTGGLDPTSRQAERILALGLESCERFYQAFQFVVWGDRTAADGLKLSLFETVGQA
ncbi:YbjN domain-containing protein [Aurantimonas sp. Leaf443]|uniref:YbjN domain-containing protein n=1 Tax=Aurantimonas sp. Leaf443 TaxID=1736378 RepID=UPI0006FC9B79|nr:YbjN domain-containing protein [Aurantimonas sp. Leaf443]KQT82533.1 hypothetical protein ASG48_15825 [Aurantimonas sp. Leaf443]